MFAKVQGEIRGTDGWKLDPCKLTEDGSLPPCPDCGTHLAPFDETTIRHTCACGSEFDIWKPNWGEARLVMARSTFSRSGHYLKWQHLG
ncbi:hypothetical protein DTL21_23175 [Bremerella cremea]|uniref:Uncharacterized protein n=1 Tax=Blastopirellula marina TaxID=124 RepID=A0A2S8FDM5_9BACT|nr:MULTISPECIES: hypothetical protein [Pirellulaceae]PQO30267.1 hypothetical protein C5Y83_23140 [Blastopirellula marina]RCS43618.1 hypothetical protein DTL21_23175 [Bremerella cremea]